MNMTTIMVPSILVAEEKHLSSSINYTFFASVYLVEKPIAPPSKV